MENKEDITALEQFKSVMSEAGFSWQTLSDNSEKIDRASLRRKVLFYITSLDKFATIMGIKIIFKKK